MTVGTHRWRAMIARSLRLLPPGRRNGLAADILATIDESADAGEPPRLGDLTSVLALVARSWLERLAALLPEAVLGLPFAVLLFLPVVAVYDSHFAPWDGLAEVPATGRVAWFRLALDRSFPVIAILSFIVGARLVRRLRSGSWPLPAFAACVSLVLMSQADLFVEHAGWYSASGTSSLTAKRAGELINAVSPWSAAMLAAAFAVPLGVATSDLLLNAAGHRAAPLPPARTPRRSDLKVLGIGLAALGGLSILPLAPVGAGLLVLSRRRSRWSSAAGLALVLMPILLVSIVLVFED